MKHFTRSLLASIAAVALTAPAAAVTYVFSFTGSFTATWELPASPTPDAVLDSAFRIDAVDMIIDGNPVTDSQEYYEADGGGGICAGFGCSVLDLYGPQLFSGTVDAPAFLLGEFALTDFGGAPLGTLTIAEGMGAIPEPATWGLMIAGFGLVGYSLRRRRSVTA